MKCRKLAGYITISSMLGMAVWSGFWYQKKERLQQELAGKILRFHVMANSDSEQDQELKRKVRDVIGSYMQEKMSEAESLSACEALVEEALPEIISLAEREVAENGYDYPVEAKLAEAEFPVKTYGDYTFPSGTYEALEVTIGAGEGHNWWCVMYPNMCFNDSMYEVPDSNAGEALREVLTEEEYEAVLRSGDYQIRFQYLTFLNGLFD